MKPFNILMKRIASKLLDNMNKKTDYYRECPQCSSKLYYRDKWNLEYATKGIKGYKTKLCMNCVYKNRIIPIKNKYERNCPDCNTVLSYANRYSLKYSEKNKCKCKRCMRLGKKHSTETIKKIRMSNIKNIEKHIKNGGTMCPKYNPEACKIIDEYGKKHGYNFQHTENGGEHHIKELGYFVDGYDKEKNVVIEVDEAHHFRNGNLRNKDIIRQKEIMNYLQCEFIRAKL